jgi:TRAP-type mannitol/chloroaromatic compound transport system substrate-binding protein
MFNPLLEDLTQVKDQELESRMTDLNKKYNIALRMGNSAIAMQIVVVLESIKQEILRRQHEASKKLLAKQNKDLDGLINIG